MSGFIGVTSVGVAGNDNPANNVVWQKAIVLAPSTCHVTRIEAFCNLKAGDAQISVAIYADSAGKPGALLGSAGPDGVHFVGSGFDWYGKDITPVSVSASTVYWLAFLVESGGSFHDINVDFDTNGSTVESYFTAAIASSFPSPAPGSPTPITNERWSIRGVLDLAGQTISVGFLGSTAAVFTPSESGGGTTLSAPFLSSSAQIFAPNFSGSGQPQTFPIGLVQPTSLVFPPQLSAPAQNFGYATGFPNTENPISEGGAWVNGGDVGGAWHNVRTQPGRAFGTMTGSESGASQFSDSIAHLAANFPADFDISGVVNDTALNGDYGAEVELLGRFLITPGNARGYELNCAVRGSAGTYCTIVRWNGALGDFTTLQTTFPGAVGPGDLVRFTGVGSLLKAFINGSLVNQATDPTWATGHPGMGFFLRNRTQVGDSTAFGFSRFTVGNAQAPLMPFLGSTASVFGLNIGSFSTINPPFIPSSEQVFGPTFPTPTAERDMGVITGEAFAPFGQPRSVSAIRIQVLTFRSNTWRYGVEHPISFRHLGGIGLYRLALNDVGDIAPFIVFSASVNQEQQLLEVPGVLGVPLVADGWFYRLNPLASLHAWLE